MMSSVQVLTKLQCSEIPLRLSREAETWKALSDEVLGHLSPMLELVPIQQIPLMSSVASTRYTNWHMKTSCQCYIP